MVEYYHAVFNHYFITSIPVEIAALDSGQFVGWTRTGRSFGAYAQNNGSLPAVCRFFTTAFAPKSSHFYTAITAECSSVRNNPDWQFEAEAFWVPAGEHVDRKLSDGHESRSTASTTTARAARPTTGTPSIRRSVPT